MNKQKYLIVKCEEKIDGCIDRRPLGITDDISMWKRFKGYAIYEIKADGKLEIVKYYDEGDCLHICTDVRLKCYIANNRNSYVCDLTDEMKNLLD